MLLVRVGQFVSMNGCTLIGLVENAKAEKPVGLEQQLTESVQVIDRLRAGELDYEAQVKHSVILPILRTLGWNTDAPEQLRAEFPTGRAKKVDYALLHLGKPRVFIEAKRLGAAEDRDAQEQLFGYARDMGIPILVLTDGRWWEFYFGMGAGAWEERCFRRFALDDDQSVTSHAQFLTAHLGRRAVASGEAHDSANVLLRQRQELEHARSALPEAWRTVLREPHPKLCELLGEVVTAECEVKPRPEDIASFLKNAAREFGPNHSLGATVAPDDSETPGPTGTQRRKVSEKGLHPVDKLILQVLINRGGSGHRREVLSEVEHMMTPSLGDKDREPVSGGRLRWQRNTEVRVVKMRERKWLEQPSETTKGRWKITDLGRTQSGLSQHESHQV